MALQPERFTQSTVTSTTRELLPHVFTLTCRLLNIGGLISVALSVSKTPFVSKGSALYAVRTFLSRRSDRSVRNAKL